MNVHAKGTLVRCSAAFADGAGTAQDPTAVRFKYRKPSGNIVTLLHGTDAALVKDSTGNYHVDLSVDVAGLWDYRFESTGSGQAAENGQFRVRGNPLDLTDA